MRCSAGFGMTGMVFRRFVQRYIAFVAVLMSLWMASTASGQAAPIALSSASGEIDLAGKVQYLADASGKLTIADVRQRTGEFKTWPASADLNFGYQGRVYWIRLPFVANQDAPHDWVLEVAYPPLGNVDVYLADGKVLHGGANVPYTSRPVGHRNHVFRFQPAALPAASPAQDDKAAKAAPVTELLMRVESETTGLIPVRLRSEQVFHNYNTNSMFAMGLYYGLLFALGAYNLMLFVALRSAAFGYYVLWIVALAGGVAGLNGVAAQYVWRDWGEGNIVVLPVFLLASNACAILFSRNFLDSRRNFPTFDRLLLVLGWYSLIACLLTPLLPLRLAIQGMSITAITVTSMLIGLAVVSVRRGVPSARYYLAAWIVLLLGSLLTAMRNFGLVPNMFISQYGLQLGSAFEMLLLSFALAARFNELKRAREEAMRQHEAELESRVHERTAELAATNVRLADSEAQLRALANQDALTGLANRRHFAEVLEVAIAQTSRMNASMAVLLIDLDGFKPVNDRHGHAAGDKVLETVAARLRAAVRAHDVAARIGGDEFAVVLSAPQTQADAERVGMKLVEVISAPIALGTPDGESVTVGASVGVVLTGAATTTADALMAQADAAMYAAKAAGRGHVQVYGTQIGTLTAAA